MSVSFGSAIIVKSKNYAPINVLSELNHGWKQEEDRKLCFSDLHHDTDRNGFYKGILCNKEEKDVLNSLSTMVNKEFTTSNNPKSLKKLCNIAMEFADYLIENATQEVVLTDTDDIKKIPMLKGENLDITL